MEFKTKKKLSSGLCSNAYLLDDEYIQLEGKSKESYNTYKDIKNNSDLLIGKITCVEFPSNMSLVNPGEEYPYGALIYKMVKGSPLNPDGLTIKEQDELARTIIQFNTQMHNSEIHWDRERAINHELEKIDKNIEILNAYLKENELLQLKKYRQLFSDYLNSKKSFCITHGDLWADNLIVDEKNQLTGVIDFANMAYFLPEVDYASMWNMIDGFIDKLLLYTQEDVTKESINLFIVHRELCSFEYILEIEPEDVECQIEKLRQAMTFIFPVNINKR